jgi:SAM-dependent methyltransferase
LAARLAGRRAARAVSVGAGLGSKEMTLVRTGLIERFELFELSEVRCERGRAAAAADGLGERVTFHAADAFARPHEPYDLVHWDHSLHHMLDVAAAVTWSVDMLAPGGLLVINDYVGPTRLQWTRAKVRFAREVMAAAAPHLGGAPPVNFKVPVLSRLRQTMRDPSEAPQSDRIIRACRAACGGYAPAAIGCAMINIAGPGVVSHCDEGNPALQLLCDWDRKAEAAGLSHFAFGIWQKPT